MSRALGIHELIIVSLVLQNFGEPGISGDPIAARFGRRFGTVIVLRNLNPNPERLLLAVREEVLDIFIGAERSLCTGAETHERTGIGENAVIEIRTEPCHRQSNRAS